MQSVADIPDSELVKREVRSIVKKRTKRTPAWVAVGDAFALGSTYSAQLCRRFRIDPHTGAQLPEQTPNL